MFNRINSLIVRAQTAQQGQAVVEYALVIGFISLVAPKYPPRPVLAIAYGVGLAMAFDEFGMWLRLTDQYNLDSSEDVMVGILAFLVIAVYFTGLLRRAFKYMRR